MASMDPPPPPFRPPSPTTTSVSPTSYRSTRQNELDALRSKGLAKIFNRHFTDATEKITLEREAADAALVEIIARKAEIKANPKLFETDGLSLTQLDALHMKLQKRKLTVQRKEQETKELYKRYVTQYGGNEAMAQNALSKHGALNGSTMPVLHENRDYDILRQSDLVTARAKEKKNCEGVASPTAQKLKDGSFYETDSTRVPSPTNRIGRLNEKGSTVEPPPLVDITSEQNSDNRLDSADVIVSTDISTKSQPQDDSSLNVDDLDVPPSISPSASFGNMSGLNSSFLGGVMVDFGTGNQDDEDSEDDADSIMSGLTSMDGATVAIAEFKLTEFLKEETANIRKMFSSNIGDSEYDDDDDDLNSIATFQTHTSLESQRAVLAAKKAEDLVKKMEEDTAWMNNPELLNNDSDEESDEGEKDSQGSHVKPHWIAYYDKENKKVYYHNSITNQTCWTEPRDATIDKSALDKSILGDDSNCDEEDTVVVKDYTNAERKDDQPQSRGMSENLAAIDQYRPNADGMSVGSGISRSSRTSKVMIFKRKRALKRRRRNRIIVAFTVACSLFGVGVYKSREQWMPVVGLQTIRQKAIEEERILKEVADAAAEKAKEMRLRKEENERKLAADAKRKKAELAAKKKAEDEQKKAELAAKKQAEDKQKKAELAAKKKAEDEQKKAELEAKKKAELEAKKKAEDKRIETELVAQKKAEEARIKAEIAAKKKAEKAAKKKAEADRQKAELEAKKKAQDEQRMAELAAKEKAEEERRVAELAAKKADEERIVAALAAKERADEERRVAELAEKKAEEKRRVTELAAKKAKEEQIKAELEANAKAEEKRRQVELAAKERAEEERIIKAKLEAAKKAEEERKDEERRLIELKVEEEQKLVKLKAEEETRRKKEEVEQLRERLRKEIEEQIREDERKKIQAEDLESKKITASVILFTKNKTRCHIPFACYLIKQCRKSVRKKPLFDIKWIVDSMMQ